MSTRPLDLTPPIPPNQRPSSAFLARLPGVSRQRLLDLSTRITLTAGEHLSEAAAPLTCAYLP
jgi:hypothetical protein